MTIPNKEPKIHKLKTISNQQLLTNQIPVHHHHSMSTFATTTNNSQFKHYPFNPQNPLPQTQSSSNTVPKSQDINIQMTNTINTLTHPSNNNNPEAQNKLFPKRNPHTIYPIINQQKQLNHNPNNIHKRTKRPRKRQRPHLLVPSTTSILVLLDLGGQIDSWKVGDIEGLLRHHLHDVTLLKHSPPDGRAVAALVAGVVLDVEDGLGVR